MRTCVLVLVSILFSSVSFASDFLESRDLISPYDFAPDRDDGHASAAARSLMGKFDVSFMVVTGAVGLNSNRYIQEAGALQDRIKVFIGNVFKTSTIVVDGQY